MYCLEPDPLFGIVSLLRDASKLGVGVCIISCLPVLVQAETAQTVQNRGVEVTIAASGNYVIESKASALLLKGKLPFAPAAIDVRRGQDAIGAFHELDAKLGKNGRMASIRLYDKQSSVLLIDQHKRADPNMRSFPVFQVQPATVLRASYRDVPFSPIQFGKLNSLGPWLFFTRNEHALVVSPANNFLVSELGEDKSGMMYSGIDHRISELPANFRHETLLTFGTGINNTLQAWGANLQRLGHKRPVQNDADVLLAKFGYWTDNGAHYYYRFDHQLGYQGTLLAVRDQFASLGVPLAYMQLDSWWYPKAKGDNPWGDNGEMIYRADPKIFPHGLQAFSKKLGLPLITHARWVSPNSPYRSQYRMSKNVIIDPRFWRATADYLHNGGVIAYEQDWLNANARPAINISQSHDFLADMANGMARKGIGIQYCMALPAYFMASTKYQNVRTIRSSDDRFIRPRWDSFLYTSQLAHSVGLWPWSDVFMSNELPNLVLATLSAGPVGTGDALGQINAANLKQAMRRDSVLLKPDVPLAPIDEMYIADATTSGNASRVPMVAETDTAFGSATEHYVFAYPRVISDTKVSVPLRELGVHGQVYAWNWVAHTGELLHVGSSLQMPFVNGWAYTVLAPVNSAGIALLGDTDKITPLARKRFRNVSNMNEVDATIRFAPHEGSVPLTGYSAQAPKVRVLEGKVSNLTYSAITHLFTFVVHPDHRFEARVRITGSAD